MTSVDGSGAITLGAGPANATVTLSGDTVTARYVASDNTVATETHVISATIEPVELDNGSNELSKCNNITLRGAWGW